MEDSSQPRKWARWVLLAGWLLITSLTPIFFTYGYSAEIETDEPRVRAALVAGIFRYTLWDAFVTSKDNIVVCLMGQPLSQPHLLSEIDGQSYGSRFIRVVEKETPDLKNCHAAVIGEALTRGTVKNIADLANDSRVLTICDACNPDVANRIMIDLITRRQRLRFSVDLRRIKSAGIRLNSSLLELAAEVKR